VLLSEDSSVTRSVAAQVLRNLGYQVDAVTNGSEALLAAQRTTYDLILLDCETPEMNGYEAARAIRRLPGGTGSRVPILGLTAGSTGANRERRQAAGMNDYIVKPIRPQVVASVLARWDVNAHSSIAPPLAVDREVLMSLTEIAGDSHPTLFDEIIELFLGSTPMRMAEMRQAYKKKDAKALGEVAHNLRGSSGQLGAARIEQTCVAVETLASAHSLKGVPALLDQLDLDFERVKIDLLTFSRERRAHLAKPETPQPISNQHLLEVSRAKLEGKRLLVVHDDLQVVADLEAALQGTGCSLRRVRPEDAPFSGDLLFWGTGIEGLELLRDQGLRLPVMVLSRDADAAVIDHVQRLGGDFVLLPFHPNDLQLRTVLRLTNPLPDRTETPAPAASGPQELLVAEDDALIARFLVSNLDGAGFRTTLVRDGEAALQALNQKPYAVAILDINMPKTDGFGVLSQLRLRPQAQRIPVMMLSARVQEHDIVKAFDLGADDYVTKPFNPLELVMRVRRLARRQ
jgi:CheY-like chemotaxis protein/HPt (histidine-containing phosphotransfer) domain-containing protein